MIEWFEDLSVGMRFESGPVRISEEDIKQFASRFDPQPFHLDDQAARKTMFKGVAASGWHTAAIAMRLAVEARPFGPHPLIGLGVGWSSLGDPCPSGRHAADRRRSRQPDAFEVEAARNRPREMDATQPER